MKISFVIPAYNEAARIGACLESIQKALRSVACDAEVIVVDNASTDGTGAVARSFAGVRVIDEPHKGIVWARRAGYLASTGDIVANIDSDTVMPHGWLARVLKEFADDRDLLALSGPYIYYDRPLLERACIRTFYVIGFAVDRMQKLVSGSTSMLQGGNFVVRRVAIERIGGFDTSIEFYGEDIDIGRRIGKIGKVKWTFRLPMHSSGRRFAEEGLLVTGFRYAVNFIWVTCLGCPFDTTYADVRPDPQRAELAEASKRV